MPKYHWESRGQTWGLALPFNKLGYLGQAKSLNLSKFQWLLLAHNSRMRWTRREVFKISFQQQNCYANSKYKREKVRVTLFEAKMGDPKPQINSIQLVPPVALDILIEFPHRILRTPSSPAWKPTGLELPSTSQHYSRQSGFKRRTILTHSSI